MDTKSFTLRTGSRTFDAASYLRAHGADTVLVQKFLKEDVETYVKRAKLIEKVSFTMMELPLQRAIMMRSMIKFCLLKQLIRYSTMDGVSASFVLSNRSENIIGISARSLGEINVQIIMEALNGGGHLTNAATQLTGVSIEEAEEMLKDSN